MTQFIITCAARTGSTMLRYMLDGHPEISCHGEVFTARGISRFLKVDKRPYGLSPLYKHLLDEFKSRNIADFIPQYLLESGNEHIKASGFKFKTDEYFNTSFTEVSRYIRSNTEIKVIHLKRRDLLAQYISHELVKNKATSTVQFQFQNQKRLNINLLNISVSKLIRFMDDVTRRDRDIVMQMEGHDIMEMEYEKIVDPQSTAHKILQEFLEVDFHVLEQKTIKILANHYDMIKNKEEILRAIKSSLYHNRISQIFA